MNIMKKTTLQVVIVLLLAGCATHQQICQQAFYERASALPSIDGSAVGCAGSPGESYTLANELVITRDLSMFENMVQHTNKYVRAVGLLCLAAYMPKTESKIAELYRDPETIDVHYFGCTGIPLPTVGVFAQRLVESEGFRFCLVAPVGIDSNHVTTVLREYLSRPDDDRIYLKRTVEQLEKNESQQRVPR